MVSYAQFGEDVMLRRFFGEQASGFWVDVGANDPVLDSVTLHFSLSGWTGVNIEPLPDLHRRLVASRPRDLNLNLALSDRAGTLELVVDHSAPGLSTATSELAELYRQQGHRLERVEVPARTLAEVVDEHCRDRTVDFLKLDAEGHEAAILGGVDLRRFRPRVVVAEAGFRPEEWEPKLLDQGYLLAGCDVVNRYYVREEEAAGAGRLEHPANVGDRFIRWDAVQAYRAQADWNALGPAIRNMVRVLRSVKETSPGAKRLARRTLGALAPWIFRER
jgi:FkbM family methyltransferase